MVTFNLDEYYPMQAAAAQSYVTFMNENLFAHVDILRENVHIPDGTLALEEVAAFCLEYEKKITALGGLDLQILRYRPYRPHRLQRARLGAQFRHPAGYPGRPDPQRCLARLRRQAERTDQSHYHGRRHHLQGQGDHPDGLEFEKSPHR